MSHDHHHEIKPPVGWMDRPEVIKRLFTVFYVLCAVLIVAEFVLGRHTEHPHPWEWLPVFYPVWGFLSFWFLVLLARPMRTLLIRPEDYYEGSSDDE